jgi:hypothetical protein
VLFVQWLAAVTGFLHRLLLITSLLLVAVVAGTAFLIFRADTTSMGQVAVVALAVLEPAQD